MVGQVIYVVINIIIIISGECSLLKSEEDRKFAYSVTIKKTATALSEVSGDRNRQRCPWKFPLQLYKHHSLFD